MTKTPKNKLQECVRGCGRMTRKMAQFLHEAEPKPTCSFCDREEEQRNIEEENEEG
jgi:hypothetical protein